MIEESEESCRCCNHNSVLELFENNDLVTMCAPMVRYSKLAFRILVRLYGCKVAFTPMIVSNSFVESLEARHSDFSTAAEDRPLIVQFAAKNAYELTQASKIIYKHSDGVDLNCGCPQRWAIADGYGACLLDKPELVHDIVHQLRNTINDLKFTFSLKIRLHDDIKKSVEFCRRAEMAGVSWITVHGRTKLQRNEPINYDAIKIIKENLSIPVVGNGDIFQLNDSLVFKERTQVNGVMSARGLLQNPSLFTGTDVTTLTCIDDWLRISCTYGSSFTNVHHHLMFMLEKILPKHKKKMFNSFTSLSSVIDFLNEYTSQL